MIYIRPTKTPANNPCSYPEPPPWHRCGRASKWAVGENDDDLEWNVCERHVGWMGAIEMNLLSDVVTSTPQPLSIK